MTADDVAGLEIVGGHSLRLRAIALALRGPPLQWDPHDRKAVLCLFLAKCRWKMTSLLRLVDKSGNLLGFSFS